MQSRNLFANTTFKIIKLSTSIQGYHPNKSHKYFFKLIKNKANPIDAQIYGRMMTLLKAIFVGSLFTNEWKKAKAIFNVITFDETGSFSTQLQLDELRIGYVIGALIIEKLFSHFFDYLPKLSSN